MAKYYPGQLVQLGPCDYEPILYSYRMGEGAETMYGLNTTPRREVAESEIVREVAHQEYIGGETANLPLDGLMAATMLDGMLMLLENDFEAYGQDMCGSCEQELDSNGDGHLLDCNVPVRLTVSKRLYRFLKANFPKEAANFPIDWIQEGA